MLARIQPIKTSNSAKLSSDAQREIIMKQRQAYIFISSTCNFFFPLSFFLLISFSLFHLIICSIGEIMGDESWKSEINIPVSVSENQ